MKCLSCRVESLVKEDYLTKEEYNFSTFSVKYGVLYKGCYVCKVCGVYSVDFLSLLQVENLVAIYLLDNSPQNYTEVLRFARKSLGLTREELSEMLGYQNNWVKHMEESKVITQKEWDNCVNIFKALFAKKRFSIQLMELEIVYD